MLDATTQTALIERAKALDFPALRSQTGGYFAQAEGEPAWRLTVPLMSEAEAREAHTLLDAMVERARLDHRVK